MMMNNLRILIEVKANYMYIDGFDNDDINDIIDIITWKTYVMFMLCI